ncbi:MAG TPA: hypothetical protein VGD98_02580 [Ktedonobacteraceae bacterium]
MILYSKAIAKSTTQRAYYMWRTGLSDPYPTLAPFEASTRIELVLPPSVTKEERLTYLWTLLNSVWRGVGPAQPVNALNKLRIIHLRATLAWLRRELLRYNNNTVNFLATVTV